MTQRNLPHFLRVPTASLLLSGDLYLSEHSGDSAVREALAVHLEYGADDQLLAFMIDDFPGHASFTEWQVMDSIWGATGLLERDSEANQRITDRRFGSDWPIVQHLGQRPVPCR